MQVFFYICEYLGVTPAEFFDSANSHPAEFREIMEDLNALGPEKLRHVRAIIKDLRY